MSPGISTPGAVRARPLEYRSTKAAPVNSSTPPRQTVRRGTASAARPPPGKRQQPAETCGEPISAFGRPSWETSPVQWSARLDWRESNAGTSPRNPWRPPTPAFRLQFPIPARPVCAPWSESNRSRADKCAPADRIPAASFQTWWLDVYRFAAKAANNRRRSKRLHPHFILTGVQSRNNQPPHLRFRNLDPGAGSFSRLTVHPHPIFVAEQNLQTLVHVADSDALLKNAGQPGFLNANPVVLHQNLQHSVGQAAANPDGSAVY